MFNHNIGTEKKVSTKSYILTKQGVSGHVVSGNYVRLEPGRYCVAFDISLYGATSDPLVKRYGFVEVVADAGRRLIEKAPILAENLADNSHCVRVQFELAERMAVEMRVYVEGIHPLLIEEKSRPIRLTDRKDEDEAIIAATRFPDIASPGLPEFFISNVDRFRALHADRILVRIVDNAVVLNVDGVKLHASTLDDLHCLNEITISHVYNIIPPRDACVIDVGMNIALATLFFANKAKVKEVHAFEPFAETYARAIVNIGLNPDLKSKIIPYNFALSDRDEERTISIGKERPSANMSIRDNKTGRSVALSVRDAATVLGPIIEQAAAREMMVVAKIDCEGSEFEIFDSLEKAGLLRKFSALLVEWHPYSLFKDLTDLTTPLLKHGFVIIDRTSRKDRANGMFYAVRSC